MTTSNRHRRTLSLALPALLLVTWLGGCASPLAPRETVTVQTFLLEGRAAPTGARAAGADAPVLLVSAPRAASGHGGSDMVYVRQAHQLESFSRHRWVDAPARMLEPLMVSACEDSGLFSAVAAPGSQARAGLRLDSELLRLQQVFSGSTSRVELALRATLLEAATGRLLASRTIDIQEPASENTPYAGVQAANRATSRLLGELQRFLSTNTPAARAQP